MTHSTVRLLLLAAIAIAGCEDATLVSPPVTPEDTYVSPLGTVVCEGDIPASDTRFPVSTQAFTHDFDGTNPTPWCATDGRGNPRPFNSGWRADHVQVAAGSLLLKLSNQAVAGKPYGGGEFLSHYAYGYGRVSARIKPVKASGVVTALFTYTGPAAGTPHDEIDIEFLGNKPTKMQTNYFTDNVGHHEKLIELGFDASADYHDYAFEWRPGSIKWFVDNKLVHEETGARGPLPKTPGRILANVWAAVGADSWVGKFEDPGVPLEARIDRVEYKPL